MSVLSAKGNPEAGAGSRLEAIAQMALHGLHPVAVLDGEQTLILGLGPAQHGLQTDGGGSLVGALYPVLCPAG